NGVGVAGVSRGPTLLPNCYQQSGPAMACPVEELQRLTPGHSLAAPVPRLLRAVASTGRCVRSRLAEVRFLRRWGGPEHAEARFPSTLAFLIVHRHREVVEEEILPGLARTPPDPRNFVPDLFGPSHVVVADGPPMRGRRRGQCSAQVMRPS